MIREMKSAVSSSLLNSKFLLNPIPLSRFISLKSLFLPKLSLTPITNLPSSSSSSAPLRSISSMASSFNPEQARVPSALPLPAPPLTKFNIGLCQLSVTSDKKRNISHAKNAIEEAASKGAKLVLLPEIWNSPYSNDSFAVFAEDIDAGGDASPSTAMLSEVSKRLNITIIGGSIPERFGDRLYNTCCIFGSDGELKAKHRKMWGVLELASAMISGAHLLCYPGAFNMTTGPLHWELLQRARATDNQLYVATCSPARDTGAGYTAWGHSTLVGPFGEVIATTEHEEDIIIAEIDYSILDQRRTSLPLNKQRRGDLYQLVDVQRLNSE
ncbi:unnamed protein product [Thlaspi arvense]|uniref:CN hydrolase domain-containing protein n=1 Tax=Thlaspi arvense TaxID=13288 RepID=A0AAU9SZ19_THLAR|nr:unnamed protein product [Thlaspi arvense]